MISGTLTSWNPLGHSRPVTGLLCLNFTFVLLGIKDVNTVNAQSTLADLGMDSLMVAEIKQTLERNYDLVLSTQEIRSLTFARLVELSSGSGGLPFSEDSVVTAVSAEPITNGQTRDTVPVPDTTQV
jgi:fatty acid synthase